MKKKYLSLKNSLLLMSAPPVAYAATPTSSVDVIILLISALTTIFLYAGVLLLVVAIMQLILAIKDENAESKVNAASRISVAIVLITFSGTIKTLAATVGVTIT